MGNVSLPFIEDASPARRANLVSIIDSKDSCHISQTATDIVSWLTSPRRKEYGIDKMAVTLAIFEITEILMTNLLTECLSDVGRNEPTVRNRKNRAPQKSEHPIE
jgi:hypothetical protein